jgi:D-beta-D-heptose 7-phosphate kinase/D-beta-D-heptose 1-phosphate adenosyltransferase
MLRKKKNKKLVMVSGGFDPIHVGHLRMFQEAKKLGDELLVVLNCDRWLVKKKGKNFMSADDRKEIIKNFRHVDHVHVLETENMDVSEALELFRPAIFANGGDRNQKDAQDPKSSLYKEVAVCKRLGIKMVFNVGKGGKIRSSSELLNKYKNKKKKSILT